jgi:hypothetical protein
MALRIPLITSYFPEKSGSEGANSLKSTSISASGTDIISLISSDDESDDESISASASASAPAPAPTRKRRAAAKEADAPAKKAAVSTSGAMNSVNRPASSMDNEQAQYDGER